MHKHEEICKAVKDTKKAKEFFLSQLAYTIGPDRLQHLSEHHLDEYNLFDVREYDDFVKGHIPYASHIPLEQFKEQTVQFSKDKVNIFYSYCPLCQRACKAAYMAADEGYPVMVLKGGFKGWKKREFDVVEDDVSDYPG